MKENVKTEELVKLAQSGNLLYQNILYNKYKNILTKYIKEVYNPKEDVEDIISEVLIKIFLSLNSYNCQKSDFNTWAFNITKNHMIDLWRKNNVDIIYNNEVVDEIRSNGSTTIDFDQMGFDNVGCICEWIKIPKRDAKLLELKYVYGFSYEDMSCYSGISTTTIANRVNYIKSKIKTPCPK